MEDNKMDKHKVEYLVNKLRPFIHDEDQCARMYVDLIDSIEAGIWLSDAVDRFSRIDMNVGEVQDFLIELDIKYVEHTMFHSESLHRDIANVLGQIAEADPDLD